MASDPRPQPDDDNWKGEHLIRGRTDLKGWSPGYAFHGGRAPRSVQRKFPMCRAEGCAKRLDRRNKIGYCREHRHLWKG